MGKRHIGARSEMAIKRGITMDLSKKTLERLLEKIPAMVVLVNKEYRIQYINHVTSATDKASIVGKPQFEFVPEEYREEIRQKCDRVFATGQTAQYEAPGYSHDGRLLWFLVTAERVEIDDGQHYLAMHLLDITERKALNQALEQSDSIRQALIENVPGMVYRGNPDWSIVIMRGCEEISDYTPQEIAAMEHGWLSIIHPDDRQRAAKAGEEIVKSPQSAIHTYRIITKTGEVRWVEDRKKSFFQNGEFAGVDGILIDTTERQTAETQLKKAQEDLIAQQRAAIQELSTPVIQVWNDILVLPLIGTIDTVRANHLIRQLLEAIVERQAIVVIIDITGVAIVDTRVAASLIETVQAARMLGTECIITGINPEIAQTLIRSGVSLGDIKTKGNLQNGLEYAFNVTGRRVEEET